MTHLPKVADTLTAAIEAANDVELMQMRRDYARQEEEHAASAEARGGSTFYSRLSRLMSNAVDHIDAEIARRFALKQADDVAFDLVEHVTQHIFVAMQAKRTDITRLASPHADAPGRCDGYTMRFAAADGRVIEVTVTVNNPKPPKKRR
jgi:hypothetical protein